jgi:hypothetical protein
MARPVHLGVVVTDDVADAPAEINLLAFGGALLDVDVLRRGVGNNIVLDQVVVARVRLAMGVPGPVVVGRTKPSLPSDRPRP